MNALKHHRLANNIAPSNIGCISRFSAGFPIFSFVSQWFFPTFSRDFNHVPHFPLRFSPNLLRFSHIFPHFPYIFPHFPGVSHIFPGSTVPLLRPVVGLLSLVLSFSALAQQLLGAVDSGEKRLDLAADVPGFGAVANWYEEQDHDAWVLENKMV